VARRLLSEGFVVGTARRSILRLLPPYVIPRSALTQFVRVLETILKEPTTT
jgi:acetylornithine/succinyldiaminopimelate/putrescine aminotransferase